MRLRHGVGGDHPVVEQGLQVARLLLVRAVVGNDLRVARVRRLATEDDRRMRRAAEDLVHQRQLDLTVTLAAEFGPEMAGPELALPDLFLERRDQLLALGTGEVVGTAENESKRFDLVGDELVHPVQLVLEFSVCFEVPCHVLFSSNALFLKAA